MIRSRAVALGLVALMVPALAGCHAGMNADTLNQEGSGNGTQVVVEGVQVDDATIVAGRSGSGQAAFLGTVLNLTDVDDNLLAISAGGGPAKLLPEPIPLPARRSVDIQTGRTGEAEFSALSALPGTYVGVTMVFERAGQAQFNALVVPPVGYYADAAPDGARPILDKVKQTLTEAKPNAQKPAR